MVGTYPRPVSSEDVFSAREAHAPEGFGDRVLGRLRQGWCALHGHDSLLHFERDRMFLQCVSCGYESPGWELKEAPPVPMAPSAARSGLRPQPQPLVNERRIA